MDDTKSTLIRKLEKYASCLSHIVTGLQGVEEFILTEFGSDNHRNLVQMEISADEAQVIANELIEDLKEI